MLRRTAAERQADQRENRLNTRGALEEKRAASRARLEAAFLDPEAIKKEGTPPYGFTDGEINKVIDFRKMKKGEWISEEEPWRSVFITGKLKELITDPFENSQEHLPKDQRLHANLYRLVRVAAGSTLDLNTEYYESFDLPEPFSIMKNFLRQIPQLVEVERRRLKEVESKRELEKKSGRSA